MLKFKYEQNSYDYGKGIGSQAYDITTNITMNEDASFTEVMEAIIRLTKVAGYYPTKKNCIKAIEYIFDEEEY